LVFAKSLVLGRVFELARVLGFERVSEIGRVSESERVSESASVFEMGGQGFRFVMGSGSMIGCRFWLGFVWWFVWWFAWVLEFRTECLRVSVSVSGLTISRVCWCWFERACWCWFEIGRVSGTERVSESASVSESESASVFEIGGQGFRFVMGSESMMGWLISLGSVWWFVWVFGFRKECLRVSVLASASMKARELGLTFAFPASE